MLQNQCLDRATILHFSQILHTALEERLEKRFNVNFKYDRAQSFLEIEVTRLPGLTEGQNLASFCAEHSEDVCRAAIAANVKTVQTGCGSIKYGAFEPARVLPLLVLNEKLSNA